MTLNALEYIGSWLVLVPMQMERKAFGEPFDQANEAMQALQGVKV